MSFFDRLSKAVSDTAERVKGELDQMSQINRVRGEIRAEEKKIKEQGASITGLKMQLGEKALEMLRAGTLADPELQVFVGQVEQIEEQIAASQAAIAEKEAAIEAIKAETAAAREAAQAAEEAPEAGAFCPQCGSAVVAGATFCAQCGTKIS